MLNNLKCNKIKLTKSTHTNTNDLRTYFVTLLNPTHTQSKHTSKYVADI